MIKTLLEHHRDRAIRGEITNGLLDCHVSGVSSIVLHDEPGNRIRLFAASSDHDLYNNHDIYQDQYSLGVHAHHSDLRFVGVYGKAMNCTMIPVPGPGPWNEMQYTSPILKPPGLITPTGRTASLILHDRVPMLKNPVQQAHVYHTVFVPKYDAAAWLVIEGARDPNYKSTYWTNGTKIPDLTKLYKPMSQADIVGILQRTIRMME